MKKLIIGGKKMKKLIIGGIFLSFFVLRVSAVGWTPTDAGLVVNLEQGERFLLSVMG